MPKQKFYHLDLTRHELQNAVIQNLASAPSSPVKGLVYFDSTLNQYGVWNGTAWVYMVTNNANVSKSLNASAVSVMQVSGGADRTIQDFVSAGGIVKVSAAGVVSLAVAGTDFITPNGSETLANKTINATSNSISNLQTANFGAGVIDVDTALTSNSDTKIASQKATKSYIDSKTANIGVIKGAIDCSTNPNYPLATIGDKYRVSVAGLIGGASGVAVQVGDVIECYVTGVAGTHATVGANWGILQANVDAATTTTLGLTQYATNSEALAKTIANKAVTPSSLVGYTQKVSATIGDGTAITFTVTDNLNTLDKIAIVRDNATNAEIDCERTYTLNTVVLSGWIVAPVASAYRVIIIG